MRVDSSCRAETGTGADDGDVRAVVRRYLMEAAAADTEEAGTAEDPEVSGTGVIAADGAAQTDRTWYGQMEPFVEKEDVVLTPDMACAWGGLLAEMHVIAERHGQRIGSPAIWYNASEKNEIIRFDRFLQCGRYFRPGRTADDATGLYQKLCERGAELMRRADAILGTLPACAEFFLPCRMFFIIRGFWNWRQSCGGRTRTDNGSCGGWMPCAYVSVLTFKNV